MSSGYVVQKFGGTSVATPERLRAVAQRIKVAREQAKGIVVVVSAMGNATDDLIQLAHEVHDQPPSREMDMLLSTGEMVTAPLLAMALEAIGITAISLSGLQAGITTSTSHRKARIQSIVPQRVIDALQRGAVPVIAGFQGATEDLDITTLGRGGSDTSAVAVAVAIGADRCEIYTDVAGVFSADPRVVPSARLLSGITYEEMLEFAAVGARVMHPRAVEIGEAYDMPIWVRSAFDDSPGTLICRTPEPTRGEMEDRQRVRGIAAENDVAKVTIVGVPDRPGIAAQLFRPLAANGINIDIVVQNVGHDGSTDLSFTIARTDLTEARSILDEIVSQLGATSYNTNQAIAKVSVVGTGVRNSPGVFATAFAALADAGVNIEMISTSEIHLTCIIAEAQQDDAVRALHQAFELERL